jgi:hypothetical protein
MGWIEDDSQSFTIFLEVPPIPEGKIFISLITAKDIEVYPTANYVTALENEPVQINVTVRKASGFETVDDDMWVTFIANGTEVNTFRWFMNTLTATQYVTIPMPLEDLNLTINAGHEEL